MHTFVVITASATLAAMASFGLFLSGTLHNDREYRGAATVAGVGFLLLAVAALVLFL